MDCPFCIEFHRPSESLFRQIYGLDTRIVAVSDEFVAMPTLGQLFRGSLLLMPKTHQETGATLSPLELSNLNAFAENMRRQLSCFGHVVAFEHGSTCARNGACGIYHAHLHLVPVPRKVSVGELLPQVTSQHDTLLDAWQHLKGISEYALFQNTDGLVSCAELNNGHKLPSQYFRRALVELFELDRPWDWREYRNEEPDVIATLSHFGVLNVPVS